MNSIAGPKYKPVRRLDDVSKNVLKKRYFHTGEWRWSQVVDRVMAHVFPEGGIDFDETRDMLYHRFMLPNSPTLVNSGTVNGGLSACFVLPFDDTIDDIYKTKYDFAKIARKGGGCGTTLSNIRPQGSKVSGSAHGYSGGPVGFFSTICKDMEVITQSGFRAMAMMGVMSVRHPDILKFISAKTQEGIMSNTNISVMVDDEFMAAVESDSSYYTEFNGISYEKLKARDVFNLIVDGAWENGEPGLIFKEKVNKSPYTYSAQVIDATNPCGEQGLPKYGVCNLASIDLSKHMVDGKINYELLEKTVRLTTRFLDAVVSVNSYPTPEIAQWAKDNRSIGIGIMGYADCLLESGIVYGSKQAIGLLSQVMGGIAAIAEEESIYLGKIFGQPKNTISMPKPRRNVTLLSIAPTGTISILAGCSSGIEPIFSEIMERADKTGTYQIEHPMASAPHFRCAVSSNGGKEVTWQEHILTLEAAQEFVDAGVSKTINCPQLTRRSTVAEMFMMAYHMPSIKGITVYRNQSRQVEVLTPKNIKKDLCPVCGEALIKEAGCKHCSVCDFSLCEVG